MSGCASGLECSETQTTGSELVTSLWIDVAIGVVAYLGFVACRGAVAFFSARRTLPQVRRRPPPLRLGGHWQLWSWLQPVFGVSDAELLRSCGLDALMLMRVVRFGIMLFAPLTILGMGVVLPVNYTGGYYEVGYANNYTDTVGSDFIKMTMSNIPPKSDRLWVHFVCIYLFVAWACHLLVQYYKEYVALRQTYSIEGTRAAARRLPSVRHHAFRRRTTPLHSAEEGAAAEGGDEGAPGNASGAEAGGGKEAEEVGEEEEEREGSEDEGGDKGSREREEERLLGGGIGGRPTAAQEHAAAAEAVLHPGRYAVLVQDDVLEAFKLRHGRHGSYMRMLLPSLKRRRLGPKHLPADPSKGHSARWLWSSAVSEAEAGEPSKTTQATASKALDRQRAELNYRMRAAGRTLSAMFGDDFERLVPVYPTKEVDALWEALEEKEAALERLQLELGDLEAAAAAAGSACEGGGSAAGKGSSLAVEGGGGSSGKEKVTEDLEIGVGPAGAAAAAQPPGCGGVWRAARRARRLETLQAQVERAQAARDVAEAAAEARQAEVLAGVPCSSFFALFRSQQAAALAAAGANLNPLQERAFLVKAAPEPTDVNWPTLQRRWWERAIRRGVVLFFIVFIMLLPVGIFTGMTANLELMLCPDNAYEGATLSLQGTWFCETSGFANFFRKVITNFLPPLFVAVFQTNLLPPYIYACAQGEAWHISLTDLQARCLSLFYYWNVFNLFVGAMLGGSIGAALQEILQGHANHFFKILGIAIPSSCNFFINYAIFRTFVTCPLKLFNPGSLRLLVANVLRALGALPQPRTARDRTAQCPPASCRFSHEVGITVLGVVTIALGYAVIAPLILPVALLFFLFFWAVFRYNLLYVFVTAHDGQGQLWSQFAHRVVGSLGVMVALTGIVFAVQTNYVRALLLVIPLGIGLGAFNRFLTERYDAVVARLPAVAILSAPRLSVDPQLYTPPPLRPGAEGWHSQWGKAWQHWPAPRYGL